MLSAMMEFFGDVIGFALIMVQAFLSLAVASAIIGAVGWLAIALLR